MDAWQVESWKVLERIFQIFHLTSLQMRLGMTNPPYILDHLEEIAEILRHPRVYSFLHIPVQSGSDAVLSDMRREYTREHFCRIVDYMLKKSV
jgi:threonylcarbamoyladenosine tRNA methylthiotransferase CDKAL1